MESVKYQYVVSMPYDVGVYQTQVIDWLNLYRENGIDFELVHLWVINPFDFKRLKEEKRQEALIRNAYKGKVSFHHIFPEWINSFFRTINNILWRRMAWEVLKTYDHLVIFSRNNFGYSIESLKQKYGDRVCFYWDLRAAGMDEILHRMKVQQNYSDYNLKILSENIKAYYESQKVADKIFAVSEPLMTNYHQLFGTDMNKFVLYPCLSTTKKFYYDDVLRKETRKKLGYTEDNVVLVYSGGTDSTYCISNAFLALANTMSEHNDEVQLLIITKHRTQDLDDNINLFKSIKGKVKVLESVPNSEMVQYLNASDYGLLLRDNLVLNNVASPVKFAEYQLCGLPVIISESVCDYAKYSQKHNTGYVLPNENLEHFDFKSLCSLDHHSFNRKQISSLAIENLSKESQVERIVKELKPHS